MNVADTLLSVLRTVLDALLVHVPADIVQGELDAAAVRRANAIADAAEAVKFGP